MKARGPNKRTLRKRGCPLAGAFWGTKQAKTESNFVSQKGADRFVIESGEKRKLGLTG